MKRSTKVFSTLMAFVMFFSSMSICASSAHSSYEQPGGYDSIGRPYLTADQCCSLILDKIDAGLAKKQITFRQNVLVYEIDLDFTSIDKAVVSITGLVNSKFFKTVDGALGDAGDIDVYWLNQCPRRHAAGRTDLEVLFCVIKFLAANKTIVGKAFDGSLHLGLVQTIGGFKLKDETGDIPANLKESIKKALFDPEVYGEMPASMTMDQLINQKLQYALVYDPVTEKSGIMPSLDGKLNLQTTSGYMFFKNIFNSALSDIAIPKLTELLVDVLEIDISENPDGVYDGTSAMSIIWDMLIDNGKITFSEEAQGKPVKMIEEALHYYLLGDFLKQFIQMDEDGWVALDTLDEALNSLLVMGAGLVSSFNIQGITFKTEEEIAEMTNADLVAYLGKVLLNGLVDFADIPDSAQTLREVATYFLINFSADILPDKDFYSKIANGSINPATTGCLEVLAPLVRYYVNANTKMYIPDNLNFNDTITFVVNEFLKDSYFGGIICTSGMAAENGWKKMDKVFFGNSPQLCGFLQANWLPTTIDSNNITYDLLINKIIFGILDFDLSRIISIFRKNSTGELNNSMVQIVLNILGRIVNGVFENNTVFPLNQTSVESVLAPSALRSLLEALLVILPNYFEAICTSCLPLVVSALGLWDPSTFDIKAPEGTADVSIEELEELFYLQVPREQGVDYDEPGFVFFGSENFDPLYKYYDYMDVRTEARRLFERYESDPDLVTQEDITNTAYRLTYYFNRLTYKQANVTQLTNLIEETKAKGLINANYSVSPYNQNYTLRTWNQFRRAYYFADLIFCEVEIYQNSDITQAMVSEARGQLLKAVKGLKDYVPLANYTLFNEALNAAMSMTESDLEAYFEEGVEYFREVLAQAIDFDRDYDRDSQDLVDEMADKLSGAMDDLSFKPALVATDYSTTILDKDKKYAYGLPTNQTSYFAYIANVGPGLVYEVPTLNGYGTGTVIQLLVNGEVEDYCTVAIFGDVDGDAKTNANDALLISLYADGLLSASSFSDVQVFAADNNWDGYIDSIDATRLEEAGLMLSSVKQVPET